MRSNFSFLILVQILVLILLVGCSNQAAKNRNAAIVANYNKQLQNSNDNTEESNSNVNQNIEVEQFDDAKSAVEKGDEYLEANQTQAAVDVLKQAVKLDPEMPEAHFKLGVAYALIERANRSELDFPDSSDEKKNSEIAFENAIKTYNVYIKENPDDHEARFNLGLAYGKVFKEPQAERNLKRAVDLNPDNSLYRTELGASLIRLAKYSAAINHLEKAIELDENNFRAEDLLEKAKAGRKRTGFKKTPKPKKATPTPTVGRPSSAPTPRA